MIVLYNDDCFNVMNKMADKFIDVILTSPFYNTNRKAGKKRTLTNTKVRDGQYNYVRYDIHVDNMSDDEYCLYTVNLFNEFNRILKKDGCILYNLSYGSENAECMFKTVNAIITMTDFTIADCIIWKKKTAMPNSCSPNKLTRITEFVFVICRKNELKSFHSNKRATSVRPSGQKAYENISNFIEAKNNDGPCPFNKATFSSELCEKLLKIYAPADAWVYDPFMGTGTTAVACKRIGLNCYGSEISLNQVKFSIERLENEFGVIEDVVY